MISRKDLKPGQQLAQSSHALTEFIFLHPEIAKDWHQNSNYIACLSAKNEQELESLIVRLEQKNIKYAIFREPDLDNQLTAIAIEPGEASRKSCSSFPLALKE